jgi:hypothetical protein
VLIFNGFSVYADLPPLPLHTPYNNNNIYRETREERRNNVGEMIGGGGDGLTTLKISNNPNFLGFFPIFPKKSQQNPNKSPKTQLFS